jgi:uncharacterized peroxidase-related enzyme
MPHISLNNDLPGIRGLAAFRPETGRPLYELAQILLRSPGSLSAAERELIATWVSSRNECVFCTMSHAAAARELMASDPEQVVNSVMEQGSEAPVSPKLKALLLIAGKVQQGGRKVEEEDIAYARQQGATDMEIHDTVLIAAAFSMFNRYVDGLATFAPQDAQAYAEMGKRMAQGYTVPAQNS